MYIGALECLFWPSVTVNTPWESLTFAQWAIFTWNRIFIYRTKKNSWKMICNNVFWNVLIQFIQCNLSILWDIAKKRWFKLSSWNRNKSKDFCVKSHFYLTRTKFHEKWFATMYVEMYLFNSYNVIYQYFGTLPEKREF